MSRKLATLLAVAAALIAAAPAAAAPVPQPDDDPFYAQPPGLDAVAPGTVLRSRTVTATAYGIPVPAQAWQLLYRSTHNTGKPEADVATVIVPLTSFKGPRPLLAYQTAEDGVGTKCAPSYALRAGPQAGATNSEGETGLITEAVLRGWAVVVPDYEGPDSAFLGADGEAHGVLDGIRAARSFKPANVSGASPVGMIGYSGGAFATAQAAQRQADFAPELPVAGVALGGVPADVKDTLSQFDTLGIDGVIVMGVVGADRAYPEANVTSYLNAKGKAAYAAASKDCISDAGMRFAGQDINSFTNEPDVFDRPEITALLWRMSPLGSPGTPSAPVYDYHATQDELARIGPDHQLMKRYCDAGVRVQHVEVPGEHIEETIAGYRGALDWFADRFTGRYAPSNC